MWSAEVMAGIVVPSTDTGVADAPKDLQDEVVVAD
jgi:hypothetical protein